MAYIIKIDETGIVVDQELFFRGFFKNRVLYSDIVSIRLDSEPALPIEFLAPQARRGFSFLIEGNCSRFLKLKSLIWAKAGKSVFRKSIK